MGAKPQFGVGLDLGGLSTRLVVLLVERGRLRFLGAAEVPSTGWTRGRVADQQSVGQSVAEVVRAAEASTGVSVESAVVGVGGPSISGANGRGVVELGHFREIEQRDVNRVVDRATRVQLAEDRMILQLCPRDFVVDDRPRHRDPRKVMASRLELNVHLVTASALEHNAIVGAVNLGHLVVEETVFEALAACYAAVLPEHRRQGVVLIDIGAQSTELVVYSGDFMHLASNVRISGDHLTRDLAQALTLSFEDAEHVKHEFGGTSSASVPDNILVELPAPDSREARQTARRFVSEVLEARAVELFEYVRAELERVGMENALLGGAFLTGGAAKLPDLCDVADRVLQCQTRYGLPVGIRDWPATMDDPTWTTAAGLAMYSAKLKAQGNQDSGGLLGRMLR